ncbi:MmgE/PrpD family protein [Mesorhizobium sp. M1E.F.Ca.ET.045.02.1.1]|uniref:MmgE/PrpD family protein n=1 Tax=Mesorhizobium sp. M1E.F.Ca.ET.045.02.1.1 TaxID=2493672 RepID=UPI001FE1038B|nr:MmgE/PrpD family protein [Mesorhizobium sp. M1E.F.Ca.ET.045.02.1.1]
MSSRATEYVTMTLGRFAAEIPSNRLPSEVRSRATLMILDALASAAGGVETALAVSAREAAASLFAGKAASAWYAGKSLSRVGAAYSNAAATSALDIDDGHRGAAGHAGGAVVPAALAMAEDQDFTGEEILDAVAIGYDVALRIAASRKAERIDHYNSGTWAAYGAAASAGRLLRLDAARMAQALAIAGAEAPVSLPTGASMRMGSTVKEGLAWAAVTGLAAAERARAGSTGPDDLLDRGDVYDAEAMVADLGRRWEIMQTYLKPYACCRYIHSAIDAIAEMRRPGAEVRALTVEIFPAGLNLQNQPTPHSLEAAQYSYPFCCALAALQGPDAFRPMRPSALFDQRVLELAGRIDLRVATDFADAFPARTPARVTLDQGAGPGTLTVHHPRGDVANPMSREEIEDKFRVLAEGILPAAAIANVIAAVDGLARDGAMPLYAALSRRTSLNPPELAIAN